MSDGYWRILGCMTNREFWVVRQTWENSGLCYRHLRILYCVTDREFWVVLQTGKKWVMYVCN